MNEDPRASGDRRLDELTERTVDDVAALARAYGGVARREVTRAGERAAWPAATIAIGGLLAIVGVGMLFASPAVPPSSRRLRRRVRLVSLAYLTLGAVGALTGAGALVATMRRALPRTRHNLREAVDTVRDRL